MLTSNINEIRQLKTGDEILLTGEIYVARDMAHKKLKELIDNNKELPFEIKDKIIFYAGPCPNRPNEVIGSIGPTTASRMDKYAEELYNLGLLATIGKGDRSNNVINSIKKNKGKYFTVVGGIAALLSNKVIKSEIIAFEELGAEAIYKLEIEKFPVKVLID
ncbi:TPA: fumarate hydratase C-terminal domain-containing protein [Candidatus Avigastranaerophilus faecigallinarum]|nr:fumarate hydratase C-terminal domain-containing protein [Candidatus Avigastranaerophilus faecigallinarum]